VEEKDIDGLSLDIAMVLDLEYADARSAVERVLDRIKQQQHTATVHYSLNRHGAFTATTIFNGKIPPEGTKLYTH